MTYHVYTLVLSIVFNLKCYKVTHAGVYERRYHEIYTISKHSELFSSVSRINCVMD